MTWLTDIGIPRAVAPCLRGVVWHGPRGLGACHLTFDDGPVDGSTQRLLDVLDQENCRASFFMLGTEVRRAPALAREVADRGHDIAVHGFEHLDPWRTRVRYVLEDVQRGVDVIAQVCGHRPVAYRPPYGHLRMAMRRKCDQMRLPLVMWDILCGDFRRDADHRDLTHRALAASRDGSILVLHDNTTAGQVAALMTPPLIRGLRSMGLSVKPLSTFLP
jgi:peptidoglycan-N-acetylglucosamine deacetylase